MFFKNVPTMKKSLLLFVLFIISAVSTAVYSQVLPSCGGQFIDNGGINAPYLSNSNETITICPNNPGEMLR